MLTAFSYTDIHRNAIYVYLTGKRILPKMTKAQAKLELETLKEFYRKHKFNMEFDHDGHAAKVTELEEIIKGKVKPKIQTIELMERDNRPTSKYDLSCMTAPDETHAIPLFSSFAVPYDQAGSLKSAASYYKRKTPDWDYATQIRTENNKSVCRIWRLK